MLSVNTFSSFCVHHQVLEMLRRRSASSEENIDAMGLLQTLCLVKMDTVDGKKPLSAAEKKQPAKAGAAADVGGGHTPYHTGAAANDYRSLEPPEGNDHRQDTEMKGELQETQWQNVHAFTEWR